MVDFATLSRRSPEEVERALQESERTRYASEDASRDAACKKALTMTLLQEPEERVGLAGERLIMLYGTQAGQTSPTKAVYEVPMRIENRDAEGEAFDAKLRGLGGGDKVSVAGQWSRRGWTDGAGAKRETWEFKTQHFAKGEHSLDRIVELGRAERGEAVTAAPAPEREQAKVAGRAAAAARGNTGMGI